MSAPLLDASNHNLAAGTAQLADLSATGGARRFGPVLAAASDVPIPIFNRAIVFEPPARDDLSDAVAWLCDHGNPFWVTADDATADAVADLAPSLGLDEGAATQPGMALASLADLPAPSDRIDVEVVDDPESLATWAAVSGEVFGLPEPLRSEFPPAAVLDEPADTLLLGRVDGEPVGTGLTVVSEDVAGVYTIAVVESHRRQGLGEELTWATLRAGRDAGCRVGVLQSSEMGYSLYERMGFETVVTYRHFAPVRSA